MRVYPVLPSAPLRVRHRATLRLQRNPQDNRKESFKLSDAENSIYRWSDKPVMPVHAIPEMITTHAKSIDALNEQRLSLGFIPCLDPPVLKWKYRKELVDHTQLDLFDEFVRDIKTQGFLVGKNYPQIPYLEFWDDGGKHCLQLREWGGFEYLRKQDMRGVELGNAYHLGKSDRQYYVLVGNMAHRRNVWLVLHVWNVPKENLLF